MMHYINSVNFAYIISIIFFAGCAFESDPQKDNPVPVNPAVTKGLVFIFAYSYPIIIVRRRDMSNIRGVQNDMIN